MDREVMQRGLDGIREFRRREWKEAWCLKNKGMRGDKFRRVPDLAAAPEPSDEDLHWPPETLTVFWETGYITLTLEALKQLPKSQINKIYKLGGM